MGNVLIHELKVDRVKYTVEIHVYDDGYHKAIGYKPIPSTQTREKIDEKVDKWVQHYTRKTAHPEG